MYTGTQFNWHDLSDIAREQTPTVIDNSPLFIVVGSFDKGPEKMQVINNSKFNLLYGAKMSFDRHGQNAIQTQRIIDAGARVLIKRVCAKDSTLANVIFVATLNKTETQKVDTEGNKLYTDADGNEVTTADGNTPIMISSVSLKWEAKSISGCKTFEDVKKEAMKLQDLATGVFPVIIVADNGRGLTSKAFRMIPDYSTSKNIGTMFYTAAVYEGTGNRESVAVSVNPDVVYNKTSYAIDEQRMDQVHGEVDPGVYENLIAALAEALETDVDTVKTYDILYGYNNKGELVDGFSIDAESIDMNADYGVELKMGTNGNFGTAPVNTDPWIEEIRSFWAGEVTDEIWDVDTYKIACVCDANLPLPIKNEIARFVKFREDCIFLRDFGLGMDSYAKIKEAYDANNIRSRFISDYLTSYDIKDPVTDKTIKVTMLYDLAACMVPHLAKSPHAPIAGTANGFILDSAIKGTVSYVPLITPTVNQKRAIDDLRVNYAIFEDDDCVVQSEYTCQDDRYTELSYMNNVLAIQQVARAVRTKCPKQRFTLQDGTYDLSGYAKAVEDVLSNFIGNFSILRFTYTRDKLKIAQKIFNASIEFAFKPFAQSEIFDLFAINNEDNLD